MPTCRGPDGLSVDERARQALDVLRLGWPAGSAEGPSYDSDHALQLAHLHSFKQGLLFLYERMGAVTLQQEVRVAPLALCCAVVWPTRSASSGAVRGAPGRAVCCCLHAGATEAGGTFCSSERPRARLCR